MFTGSGPSKSRVLHLREDFWIACVKISLLTTPFAGRPCKCHVVFRTPCPVAAIHRVMNFSRV